MNPLSAIYGFAVRTRNSLYDSGRLPSRQLQGPVVSVGNLSVGGSGKTPFVILLGTLLRERKIKFDVLSRGYRRQSHGVAIVNPAGSAQQFGDEPLLIARNLQVPVIVGADRYQAGLLAEKTFGAQLHLLDDGFQHRSLVRDFDIVLLSEDDARDTLLPVGRLREPLTALRRADVIVLTNSDRCESLLVADKQLWRVRRGIAVKDVPARPVVFCGIARPAAFVQQLKAEGVSPVASEFYRDHHPYTRKEVRHLLGLRERHRAGGFVTTEKDTVNLGALIEELKPLIVVPVTMELLDAGAAIDTMLALIGERRRETIPLT